MGWFVLLGHHLENNDLVDSYFLIQFAIFPPIFVYDFKEGLLKFWVFFHVYFMWCIDKLEDRRPFIRHVHFYSSQEGCTLRSKVKSFPMFILFFPFPVSVHWFQCKVMVLCHGYLPRNEWRTSKYFHIEQH